MASPQTPGFPEEVRRFMAEVHGADYFAYESLEQAQNDPDGAVILSGDYGSTVFLTAPARLVSCDTDTLVTLVSDLDAVTWMSGSLTIATVAFERHPVGTRVWGAGDVGHITEGVWTHPQWLSARIRAQAEDVVLGRRHRIDGALLRRERDAELGRKRELRTRQPPLVEGLPWDFDISPPAIPLPE